MKAAIERIAADPLHGRTCDDIREGYPSAAIWSSISRAPTVWTWSASATSGWTRYGTCKQRLPTIERLLGAETRWSSGLTCGHAMFPETLIHQRSLDEPGWLEAVVSGLLSALASPDDWRLSRPRPDDEPSRIRAQLRAQRSRGGTGLQRQRSTSSTSACRRIGLPRMQSCHASTRPQSRHSIKLLIV